MTIMMQGDGAIHNAIKAKSQEQPIHERKGLVSLRASRESSEASCVLTEHISLSQHAVFTILYLYRR